MRLLLDTHAYVWWVTADTKLSRRAEEVLADAVSECLLSPVVPWEIALKVRTRGWAEAELVLEDMGEAVRTRRLTPLPITLDHARRAGDRASPHKDPFDRMLAAQSEMEGAALVTADPVFRAMGVEVIW